MRKNISTAAAMLLPAFAVMLASCASNTPREDGPVREFRPIGGIDNNLQNPAFNAVPGSAELTIAPLRFADPVTLAPFAGPNPRTVSNVIAGGAGADGTNAQSLDPVASAWLYVFGQFVDHDLSLETSSPDGARIDIEVQAGDPVFPQGGLIKMTRDNRDPQTRTVINTTAGYLDLSQLYGSTPDMAASLRTPDGRMKASHDGQSLQVINGRFVAGDRRVNENPTVAMTTTLFLREHNYWVTELERLHPEWNGDLLYDMARAITTAEYQNIIYTEYLPVLIGPVLGKYRGYDSSVNAQVTQEFSTAAFRVGHTQVSENQSGRDNDGNITYTQSLARAFFNTPARTLANGINALIRSVTAESSQATDVYTVPALRNLLYSPLPGGNVDLVDLIAIDIQRGRDVGLGTLNQTRVALGLPPHASFAALTRDKVLQAQFKALYGDIDQVDLFMGGQAEAHVEGAAVGETFQAIIARQFNALRAGDRFFWANQDFDSDIAEHIAQTTLGQVIKRNTDTAQTPQNVFMTEGGSKKTQYRAD